MTCYIGLGSNLGDRKANLEAAAEKLRALSSGGRFRASFAYQNPALVPEGAPAEWHIPFLNAAVEIQWERSPQELLAQLKRIEEELGREPAQRWAPRVIDLDLLLFGNQAFDRAGLQIPHPGLWTRPFVLDPLRDLAPSLVPPGQTESVLQRARTVQGHAPVWMGIVNVTPDSFSDGGSCVRQDALAQRLAFLVDEGVHVLDLGGESTRPGATLVDPETEWNRLCPALEVLADDRSQIFRPLVSVDTWRASVAAKALEAGADWINDVSGLQDPEMARVLAGSDCAYVLMHSLSVPADRSRTLALDVDPVAGVKAWAWGKLEELSRAGVNPDRILFDPGIGFGKTERQSLELLKRVDEFFELPVRILVGHSRKSFIKAWTNRPAADRDWESAGVSIQLAARGVDVIRAHEPQAHLRAYRAFQEASLWDKSTAPAAPPRRPEPLCQH